MKCLIWIALRLELHVLAVFADWYYIIRMLLIRLLMIMMLIELSHQYCCEHQKQIHNVHNCRLAAGFWLLAGTHKPTSIRWAHVNAAHSTRSNRRSQADSSVCGDGGACWAIYANQFATRSHKCHRKALGTRICVSVTGARRTAAFGCLWTHRAVYAIIAQVCYLLCIVYARRIHASNSMLCEFEIHPSWQRRATWRMFVYLRMRWG